MTEFIEKHDYQEILVEDIKQIYKAANDYNSFYKLPRQVRGDIGDEYTYLQAFYRGQSDSSWKIIPSICRNKDVDERISERGDLLFEVMAYEQHYIQATRLIDFTTDINIALYFACCDSMDKDGAVFLWSYSPYDSKWVRTIIQCELVNIQKDKLSIQEFAEELFGKYPELKDRYSYTDEFYAELISFLDHGFMIMQPRRQQKTNIRIQRQKDAYMCVE